MMRIVTLLARHGTQQYPDAIDNVDVLFARQLADVEHDLVVIDTALPEDYEHQLEPGRVLIGSSNAHWEFSAWDRAVSYLGHQIESYDLVHLATSAFQALDIPHLDRFDLGMLNMVADSRAALGHIDYLIEPVMLCGQSSQAWARTSWIFMPPDELQCLGSLVSIAHGERFFSGNPDAPFRVGAPLSVNYQKFILDWLTGGGRPQAVDWHSRFALTAQTLAHFEAKTLAILNEHMLAVRLRSQGCAIIDATWLAARVRRAPGPLLGAIPSWRWQVAARELLLRYEISSGLAEIQLHEASPAVRAQLLVGECWDIARSHGMATSRSLLWQAVLRDPSLLGSRPVLGALRRLHGAGGDAN
jgi:hypothetical protein